MAGKRVVRFDHDKGRGRRGSGHAGRPPRAGAKGGNPEGGDTVNVEVPRFTVPGYLAKRLDDIAQCPPGHRFLLYFQGAAYQAEMPGSNRREKNENRKALTKKMDSREWGQIYRQYSPKADWLPLKDSKKYAIKSATTIPEVSEKMLAAIRSRQHALALAGSGKIFRFHARLDAPLAIGLGNPHPVENGFSFLQPYGIAYIPGSGVKGALRRTAEALALSSDDTGWTIPLVWVLFGFDGSSGYLARTDDLPDWLQKRRHSRCEAFAEYARKKAAADPLFSWWLAQKGIRSSLPRELSGLADDPAEFCLKLQDPGDTGKKLRRSIHWQGLLRFWDVFPKATSMAVDILNPHHRDYYEGKILSPVEVEAPKPVFFLTLAPGAEMVITCELDRRCAEAPLPDGLKGLLSQAVAETVEWTGLGAKTAVGYGTGSLDPEAEAREEERRIEAEKRRQEEEEALRKAEEARRAAADPAAVRRRQLEAFVQALPSSAALPGQAAGIIEKIRGFEDDELRRACLAELRKRYKDQIKKARRNKKQWAEAFVAMCEEAGV